MSTRFLSAFGLVALASVVHSQQRRLSYVIAPTDAPALHVELTFQGDEDGSTTLVLPNRWWTE